MNNISMGMRGKANFVQWEIDDVNLHLSLDLQFAFCLKLTMHNNSNSLLRYKTRRKLI